MSKETTDGDPMEPSSALDHVEFRLPADYWQQVKRCMAENAADAERRRIESARLNGRAP